MGQLCRCECTAYHEAGHVVAAVLAQIPIASASIQPSEVDEKSGKQTLGRVHAEWTTLLQRRPDAGPLTQDERTAGEAFFRMMMAGPVAEINFTKQWHGDGANGSDYETASLLLFALCNDGIPDNFDSAAFSACMELESTKAYKLKLLESTSNVVTAFWHSITNVAQALLDNAVLDGGTLARLAHGAPYLHPDKPRIGWGICSECRQDIKKRPRSPRKVPDPTIEQLTLL